MLVLLTGLPGTGKSTIAAVVARTIGGCIVSADRIDAELAAAGVANEEGVAGYGVMRARVRTCLGDGRSVVVDAVNPFRWVRREYLQIAAVHGVAAAVVATTCSDRGVHRRRIDERRAREGEQIDWAGVERQLSYYEPFEGDACRVDAVDDVGRCCARAVEHVLARGDRRGPR